MNPADSNFVIWLKRSSRAIFLLPILAVSSAGSTWWLAIILACSVPFSAYGQVPEGSIVLPSDVSIHDVGWGRIRNLEEIRDFFSAVVETIVFVAVFAFHPKAHSLRQDIRGSQVRPSMFFFGLIGMLIGFLVVHHGYLIGFVVFGLGGLFRFRTEASPLLDGALLILVTLIGLTVGLNLPVMAVVATVAGWITLWFVAPGRTLALELRFANDEALSRALDAIRTAVDQRGFRIVSLRKRDVKPVVKLELLHKDANAINNIPLVLEDLNRAGHASRDWQVR